MKQLYFLHIPKTCGKYVSHNIKKSLDDVSVPYYISTHFPNNHNFKNKIYTSIHAGTYPCEVVNGLDVATIVRHPVSARLSYFNFIYNRYLFHREEYASLTSVKDKLRYYLFEDQNFELHNNYQSRFICNSADPRSFDEKGYYEVYGAEIMSQFRNEGKAFTWFVGNEKTSLEFAKSQIDSFTIKNTVEGIDLFKSNIADWFMTNHSIEIKFTEEPVNKSFTDYGDGNMISSHDLIKFLTKDDIAQLLKNNYIDLEIYNYVRSMENGKG